MKSLNGYKERSMAMQNTKIKLLIMMIILTLTLTGCKPWTIVKNEKSDDGDSLKIYFNSNDFDSEAYTKDLWDTQLEDYYQERQVDGKELLDLLKSNEDEAGALYGIGANTIGSAWTFVVNGTGKVLEVNKESRAGIMLLDLEPYDGVADLTIQIGPVIKGSSIRDSLDFIKLDNFSNQVEFASLSKAFNALVVSETIGTQDFSSENGQEIEYLGSFTYSNIDEILVTPIELKKMGE